MYYSHALYNNLQINFYDLPIPKKIECIIVFLQLLVNFAPGETVTAK